MSVMCKKLRFLVMLVLSLIVTNSTYAAVPNPLVHYEFEGDFSDSIGDNDGVPMGDAQIVNDAERGQVLSLDGNYDYVRLPDEAFTSVDQEFTVAFWEKAVESRYQYAFYAYYPGVVAVSLPWGTDVIWDAPYAGGNDRLSMATSDEMYAGGWNHWAFTKNAATGKMKMYHNGNFWGSTTGCTTSLSGLSLAAIGANYWGGSGFLGLIDDVRIYNSELDEDEIMELADLVAWWKLDEGGGNTATDSSCNGFNATLYDNATWDVGRIGTALHLPDSGYAYAGNFHCSGNAITVCAWVYHDSFNTNCVERYVTVGSEGAVIRKNINGQLHFYIKTDGVFRQLQADVLTENQWYHVAGTWDGTTQRLYIDGEIIESQKPGGTLDSTSGSALLGSSGEPLNGMLDDVRIYSRGLSGTEIRREVAAGFRIPDENITATASSQYSSAQHPENTVNGTGLDESGLLHDNHSGAATMWHTKNGGEGDTNPHPGTEPGAAWIEYEFDDVYELGTMWVWNFNQDNSGWPATERGLKRVTIEYSTDDTNYTKLGEYVFNIAPGTAGYAHNIEVDFSGAQAKYVVITAHTTGGNWGAIDYGLSEVRFFGMPAPYYFDGSISRNVLDNYLSRAVSHIWYCTNDTGISVNEMLRLFNNVGAKFIGRAACRWGNYDNDNSYFNLVASRVNSLHNQDPEAIAQACVLEIVDTTVESVPIPSWVFQAWGHSPQSRNFDYDAMLYPYPKYHNHWGPGASVPDMSRQETKYWFYYRSKRYIDAGCEAIDYAQIHLMDDRDTGHSHWKDMVSKVRNYAATNARRNMVLCDAHTHGVVVSGELLFDFHAFPCRPKEVLSSPEDCTLVKYYQDSIYGRSAGGITPSGWYCSHAPYIVEVDNFGVSNHPGQGSHSEHWIWGYDEICWFAKQSKNYRNNWIEYAWDWVIANDSVGWFQMPSSRCLAFEINGTWIYCANTQNPSCPYGFNQEETIKKIWSE